MSMLELVSQLLTLNWKKTLIETETANQDLEQQANYGEAAIMPTQKENIELIQEWLTAQVEAEEPQESIGDNQNFQLTPGQVGQVQGIQDSDIDYAKHRSTVTDVGLWTKLSHKEVSYWVGRRSISSSACLWTIF